MKVFPAHSANSCMGVSMCERMWIENFFLFVFLTENSERRNRLTIFFFVLFFSYFYFNFAFRYTHQLQSVVLCPFEYSILSYNFFLISRIQKNHQFASNKDATNKTNKLNWYKLSPPATFPAKEQTEWKQCNWIAKWIE